MVFLSSTRSSSHELALAPAVGPFAEEEPVRVGLAHVAWQMESFEDLKAIHQQLKTKKVHIAGIGEHGISIGIYCLDPDKNKIELFYELPRSQWPTTGVFKGKFPMELEEDSG